MLSAARTLQKSIGSGTPLPRIDALRDFYSWGGNFRRGEVVMIAGRSGAQKSGFALWLVSQWNLPTLYFSGDMSPKQAGIRLASSRLGLDGDEVQRLWDEDPKNVLPALSDLNIDFSFGTITWSSMATSLEAQVELFNRFPEVIVVDNLMDMEGSPSDYSEQVGAMQSLFEVCRLTGATVIILHHASDKTEAAKARPKWPPARHEIKNGLAEKPELSITVALDDEARVDGTHDFRMAVVKQRMGRQDVAATSPIRLTAIPDKTQFVAYRQPTMNVGGVTIGDI